MRIHLLKLFLNESGKRRRKTGLITFALAWGSLSLLLLMSFGRGLSETFQESFKGLGDRLLIISGGQSSMVHQGLPKGRKISLYPEDVELIRAQAQGIRYISPESMTTLTLSYRGKETGRNVSGVYPEFANMRNQIPQEGGRFLNETDERERRRVVFLGWAVAENLFPDEEAVGKRVLINRVPFTVIGVMKKKLQTSSYEGTDAEMVYIPFSSYIQFQENRQIYMIHVEPESGGGAAGLEKKIKELLGRKYRFNPEDTYALNVWDTIEQAQERLRLKLAQIDDEYAQMFISAGQARDVQQQQAAAADAAAASTQKQAAAQTQAAQATLSAADQASRLVSEYAALNPDISP